MATVRRFFAIASLMALPLAACASNSGEVTSEAFETNPVAPTPRLQVEWRESVDVNFVGGYRARQYAAPTVLRTSNRRELVVGTDAGWVYRLRASDGKVRWRRNLEGPVHAAPAVTTSNVYVGTLHGNFYALNRQTGEVEWRVDNDRGIEGDPAASEDLVFYSTNAGRLVALDQAGGEEIWTYNRDIPREFTVKGACTPVVAGEAVHCGFADGTVAAIGKTTGEVLWETNIAGTETDFTDVDGQVFVHGDRIYASSYGAGITALDRKTGETIWTRSYDNVASATYAEGTIYLTIATGRVVALDARDGSGKWGFEMEQNLPVDAEATGSYLFVSTGSGPMYILDRSTGYPLRSWDPASGIHAAVSFSDRSTYALSNNGYLYSLRLAF